MNHNFTHETLRTLLRSLGAEDCAATEVTLSGRADGLPSPFAVGAFASASVASALVALSALHAARNGGAPPRVAVDQLEVAAAFRSERALRALGFTLPAPWDPIAGDYATRDGFVRLHTNYRHHREAALRALGVREDRSEVAARLRDASAVDVDEAVVAEGGAAAALRTQTDWRKHPQGRAVASEPLRAMREGSGPALPLGRATLPLSGVRVLDLTRVIAGPVCTRVLSAYGADVLRIDPPGFEEVPALLGDTTWGKRRAALDAKSGPGREQLERLLTAAHVVVVGYRPAARDALGLAPERLARDYPGIVSANLSAYGHTGPWAGRRGFDSLVQMSTGIAARGREQARAAVPVPLPAQALDHGTGYLLAAAVALALRTRLREGAGSTIRLSLARTAELLTALGDQHVQAETTIRDAEADALTVAVDTDFGPMRRLPVPGRLSGLVPTASVPAGPLGVHPARFAEPRAD